MARDASHGFCIEAARMEGVLIRRTLSPTCRGFGARNGEGVDVRD